MNDFNVTRTLDANAGIQSQSKKDEFNESRGVRFYDKRGQETELVAKVEKQRSSAVTFGNKGQKQDVSQNKISKPRNESMKNSKVADSSSKKGDAGGYISRSVANFDDDESNDEVMPGDKKRQKELVKQFKKELKVKSEAQLATIGKGLKPNARFDYFSELL